MMWSHQWKDPVMARLNVHIFRNVSWCLARIRENKVIQFQTIPNARALTTKQSRDLDQPDPEIRLSFRISEFGKSCGKLCVQRIYELRKHDGFYKIRFSYTLRVHEFKEYVSARPQVRKRNVGLYFPQRLLEYPFADIHVSVK